MIAHMEERRPDLSPEELQQQLNEAFAGVRAPEWRGIAQPPPEPPRELTSKEIQQRLNDLFGDMPSRPAPTPRPPSRPLHARGTSTAFERSICGPEVPNAWPSVRPPPEPTPKLTPEEIQQRLNEAFGPWEWMKSHPLPGLSPRRRRSLLRTAAHDRGAIAPSALRRAGQEPVQDRQEWRQGFSRPLLQRLGDGERALLGAWRRFDGSEDPRGQGARRRRDGRGAAQVGCAATGRREEIPRGSQARREMGNRTDARTRPRRGAQA